MPEFSIPTVDRPDEAEKAWQGARAAAEALLGGRVGDERIYRIEYTDGGEPWFAQVGSGHRHLEAGDWVVCILKSDAYLVVGNSRGIFRGEPIRVEAEAVGEVVHFDGYEPAG